MVQTHKTKNATIWHPNNYVYILYSKRDLNPHSCNSQGILSPSCLPIPPFEHPFKERAENETRTRDPNLGKVMLYQLSYFRIVYSIVSCFPDCECKGIAFSETTKTFEHFFYKFFSQIVASIRLSIYVKKHGLQQKF